MLNRWDSRKGSEVSLVAKELAKRKAVIGDEVAARKRSSNALMNAIATAQGLPVPHHYLLEVDDGDT